MESDSRFIGSEGESLVYPRRGTMALTSDRNLRQRLQEENSNRSKSAIQSVSILQENLVILDQSDIDDWRHKRFCFDEDCELDDHQLHLGDVIEKEWILQGTHSEADWEEVPNNWEILTTKMTNLSQIYIDVDNFSDISSAVLKILKSQFGWKTVRIHQLDITMKIWSEVRKNFRSLQYLHCKNIEDGVVLVMNCYCSNIRVLQADESDFCHHNCLADGLCFVTGMTSDLTFKRQDMRKGYANKMESLASLCMTAPPAGYPLDQPGGLTLTEFLDSLSTLSKDDWKKEPVRFYPCRIGDSDVPNIVLLCPNLEHLFLFNTTINDHTLNLILQLKKLHTLRISILPPDYDDYHHDEEQNASPDENPAESCGKGVSFGGLMLFLKYAFHKDRQISCVHLYNRFRLNSRQLDDMKSWSDCTEVDSVELSIHGESERLIPLSIETMTEPETETLIDGIVVTSMHAKVTSRANSPALRLKKSSLCRRARDLVVKTLSLCNQQKSDHKTSRN
jgi:hypothetical protein